MKQTNFALLPGCRALKSNPDFKEKIELLLKVLRWCDLCKHKNVYLTNYLITETLSESLGTKNMINPSLLAIFLIHQSGSHAESKLLGSFVYSYTFLNIETSHSNASETV